MCIRDRDVVLLHENEKEIYGDAAGRCLELMKAFYGDHFKCVFDFANFVQCGQDTMEALSLIHIYVQSIYQLFKGKTGSLRAKLGPVLG